MICNGQTSQAPHTSNLVKKTRKAWTWANDVRVIFCKNAVLPVSDRSSVRLLLPCDCVCFFSQGQFNASEGYTAWLLKICRGHSWKSFSGTITFLLFTVIHFAKFFKCKIATLAAFSLSNRIKKCLFKHVSSGSCWSLSYHMLWSRQNVLKSYPRLILPNTDCGCLQGKSML